MKDLIRGELLEAQSALADLLANEEMLDRIEDAAVLLSQTFTAKGRVWSAGNGGSMCDAMHFAEELSGRYREDREALAAMAFGDPGFLTCAGNDFGYERVFERAVEAHCRKGDVLVLFSTSGTSANILAAARKAKERQVTVIGLTGRSGTEFETLCEVCLVTPGGKYADRVQELHIKIVHILIAGVERLLFQL
ncbi:MAG: SIS domain-containing protein [Fimbriimonadaceae bacterium]